jgi:hypothetical protein
MAEEPGHDKPAEELSEEIARSRDIVSRSLGELRYELDFPRKIRRSFKRQSFAWITAAIVVGALLAIRPGRRKKTYANRNNAGKPANRLLEAGFVLGTLRIAASLLKPLVVGFLKERIREYTTSSRPFKKP